MIIGQYIDKGSGLKVKLERNDLCSCGSGKKYKKCCLLRAELQTTNKQSATASIPDAIHIAIEHQKAGRVLEAGSIYQQILRIDSDNLDALHLFGVLAHETGRHEIAAELISKALALKPDFVEARCNLGTVFQALNRLDEAVETFRSALAYKSDMAEVHNNLGLALNGLGKTGDAEESFRRALTIKPDFAVAYYNLANLQKDNGQFEGAMESYRGTLDLESDFQFVYGDYLYCQMQCCNWEGINKVINEVLVAVENGMMVSTPFILLTIPATLAQQKKCAEIYVQEKYPEVPTTSNVNDKYSHDKIRLGYFSSDFYNHATAHLMAELLEQHDRSKF